MAVLPSRGSINPLTSKTKRVYNLTMRSLIPSLLFTILIAPSLRAAEDPYAAQLFQQNCASCHEAAAAAPGARIPPVSVLKSMTPTAILKAMEGGIMRTQAAVMSANERQAVANFLGTAVTVERRRDQLATSCTAGAAWKNGPGWTSWGAGLANMRFQAEREAGLRVEDVPGLVVKWAFAFPDTAVLRSQPAVYRGRVFVGSQ